MGVKELRVAVVLPLGAGCCRQGLVSELKGLEGHRGGSAGPGLRVEAMVAFASLGYPACLP